MPFQRGIMKGDEGVGEQVEAAIVKDECIEHMRNRKIPFRPFYVSLVPTKCTVVCSDGHHSDAVACAPLFHRHLDES